MTFSEHFPESELTTNGKHPEIPNVPPAGLIPNGELISAKLEQARAIWSAKLGRECHVRISYGYRCPALNTAVGSVSTTSAHLEFLAADAIPEGMAVREAWDALRLDPTFMEDVDQLIVERGCVHIGLATSVRTGHPRHELRTEAPGPHYPIWAIWPGEAGVSN
jgi:hypothetical protein